MAAGGQETSRRDTHEHTRAATADRTDVLLRLRTATAPEHQRVEDTLALLDPELTVPRLAGTLTRMHAFWVGAEAGLDRWAAAEPADAAALEWSRRRRAHLFAADLTALGHPVPEVPDERPELDPVTGTDAALGRLYVLEGSTLGGVFIDRHLAALPRLAGLPRLRAFSPYGADTGTMWAAFRRHTRARVAAGGDVETLVGAARRTFGALADWCAAARTGADPRPAGTPGGRQS